MCIFRNSVGLKISEIERSLRLRIVYISKIVQVGVFFRFDFFLLLRNDQSWKMFESLEYLKLKFDRTI